MLYAVITGPPPVSSHILICEFALTTIFGTRVQASEQMVLIIFCDGPEHMLACTPFESTNVCRHPCAHLRRPTPLVRAKFFQELRSPNCVHWVTRLRTAITMAKVLKVIATRISKVTTTLTRKSRSVFFASSTKDATDLT